MMTPNGRFKQNFSICLSISEYHPESWNPVWKTETILTALISFMNSEETAAGCITATTNQRVHMAKDSIKFNMTQVPNFESIFSEYFD